jgi:FixJ family two-component response regulator
MAGDKGALHWRRTIKTDIDVFVADVILQGSNGPGLVSSLKRVQPAARVLFISGFELSELSRRGILSSPDLIGGSVEFLQKPFAPEVFMCAVERLIASGGKKT